MFETPSIDDFKNYFFRDFPFGDDETSQVLDQDIQNALDRAAVNFNPNLWSTQNSFTQGYLLLTAHYLVTNLRASSQGINGKYSWLTASKGVGSVNEGFSFPQRILDNPLFAMLSQTRYGALFLELLLPRLSGQILSIDGATKA